MDKDNPWYSDEQAMRKLIGKTIADVVHQKDTERAVNGWPKLIFTDGTQAVIVGGDMDIDILLE